MSQDPTDYGLVFAFPDQSQSFTLGFEAGMLWQLLQQGPPVVDRGVEEGLPLRHENLEVMHRMAAAAGYAVRSLPAEQGWVRVRLTRGAGRPTLSLVSG